MLLLGLLLLVLVVLACLAAILRGGDPVHVDLELFSVDTHANIVFAAGAVTFVVLLLALWLLSAGMKRSRRRRQEVKTLRKRAEATEVSSRRAGTTSGSTVTGSSTPTSMGPDDHFDSAPRDR